MCTFFSKSSMQTDTKAKFAAHPILYATSMEFEPVDANVAYGVDGASCVDRYRQPRWGGSCTLRIVHKACCIA